MYSHQDNRRYLLVLALVTGLLGLGLAITAVNVWQQSRYVERSARLQADSVVAMTFQLEREFLRTRHELQLALARGAAGDWTSVQRRFDILVSRIDLLRESPTVAPLTLTDVYLQLWPELQTLQEKTDPLLVTPSRAQTGLEQVLARMVQMGPQVQALSQTANGLAAHQMEEQLKLATAQERQLLWLLIAQAGLLLLATLGLWWRHRNQVREHRQLQQLNRELARARDAAEQADRTKSQFLANMSHELRTPFNGMLGMMEQLENGPLNEAQRDQLQTAQHSARHLLNLLNDILDLSALDAGKLRIHSEPVQMRTLIHEVQQWVQALACAKGLTLTVHMDRDCPDWVLLDPTRVRQILLNLLSNAVKFTAKGHVRIDVRSHTQDDGQVLWTLEVQDTGCGMDAATLDRVFERFVQGDDSLTRPQGGTGLGLEISRTLARRMGGDITASSVPGQGSCFRLVLRAALANEPAGSPALQPTTADTTPPDTDTRRWHVLVAEDHPVNRKVLGIMLRNLGHQVSFAEDGAQALAMAREQTFDLVLMDIHMPHMNGLDSARAIRALPDERSQVPIIAVTADVMNDAQSRSLQAGMDDFIAKPIEPKKLAQAMQACVSRLQALRPHRSAVLSGMPMHSASA